MYKKEVLKDEKVSTYQNNKLISVKYYSDPDIYPMHRPKLDDYPWAY
jgi:hypothetical protein